MNTIITSQVKGFGRGKVLGFPTINMEIPPDMTWKEGIYAAWVKIQEKTFMGALHYGPVPVFDQTKQSLEVFLLDVADADIGDTTRIEITQVKYLREIRSFSTEALLIEQMTTDVADVRTALAA